MNKFLLAALLCGALTFSACSESTDDSYPEETQNKSLRAWMQLNRPELLENYQPEGDYYVEVIAVGDPTADPISAHDDIWVQYDVRGRTLQGDVCLTRDSLQARQLGTFDRHTHYVPYFQFAGAPFFEEPFEEGIFRSMRQTLVLGETYAAGQGLPREFTLRTGSEVVLYLPATLVSTGTANGDGGYQGQYALDSDRPMIAHIRITDQTTNPIATESRAVDAFATNNGGFDPSERGTGTERWKIADRRAAQVYLDHTFHPGADATGLYTYAAPYSASQTELDRRINAALIERFGAGDPKQTVGEEQNVYIWYIVRFLDGFVVDTNIDEVKQIVYGEVSSSGSRLSYTPSLNKDAQLGAWYYAVPHFRYGSWGAVVTPSSNAYGGSGVVGKSATTSSTDVSSALTSYYGTVTNTIHPDLSGNYYSSFYNYSHDGKGNPPAETYSDNLYQGSLLDSTTSWSSGGGLTSTTTKTTVTEILPYTPLLIQFYIEPK